MQNVNVVVLRPPKISFQRSWGEVKDETSLSTLMFDFCFKTVSLLMKSWLLSMTLFARFVLFWILLWICGYFKKDITCVSTCVYFVFAGWYFARLGLYRHHSLLASTVRACIFLLTKYIIYDTLQDKSVYYYYYYYLLLR